MMEGEWKVGLKNGGVGKNISVEYGYFKAMEESK